MGIVYFFAAIVILIAAAEALWPFLVIAGIIYVVLAIWALFS